MHDPGDRLAHNCGLRRPRRWRPGRRIFSLVLVLVVTSAYGEQRELAPTFSDATEASGIRFLHSFGDDELSNIIESSGSGCAFLDYNNDHWLDLYVVNGSYNPAINDGPGSDAHRSARNRLYRNNGDGTFTDTTDEAGCGDTGYGMACVAGDIDNDGDSDLYITNVGRNTLYRNNADGTFTDITLAAGVGDTLTGIGCAFLDIDNDGDLDLYAGNYLAYDSEYRLYYAADVFPGPMAYPGQRDVLYRNNGDLTFTDITEAAGVSNEGRAMGVAAADYDNDGWVDILVANDAMENYLYRNNGNATFTDVALESGVAYSANGDASSSMGVAFGDYDNDADLDILVPDMTFNNLYMNLGAGLFQDVTAYVGLAEVSGQFVSWSGHFTDFDNDGYLDLLISNGDAHRLDSMESLLLMNVLGERNERTFRDFTGGSDSWFLQKSVGRGMAVADYDNDGDVDFFIVNLDQASKLIRNHGDNRGHWLLVDLVGQRSNRDGYGARVTVRLGDQLHVAEKQSATGYLSQSDPRLHFGLGDREWVDEIRVRWPSGALQTIANVRADTLITITELPD